MQIIKEAPEIHIGTRKVGPGHIPLVIAEIGINHGGSLTEAMKLVDAACMAGVEVIKHQTHVVEDEMSHSRKLKRLDLSNYLRICIIGIR
jgi:N-acetylneuraminate synthase